MEITDAMDRQLYAAARENKRPTHWVMSNAAWTQLRYESSNILIFANPRSNERSYKGVPIFTDDAVEWAELRFEPVDDRHREEALLAMYDMILQDYRERIKPVADEIVAIRARRSYTKFIPTPSSASGEG